MFFWIRNGRSGWTVVSSMRVRLSQRTYIGNIGAAKCNQFARLLSSFQREVSCVSTSTDERSRSPYVSQEVVRL